MRYLLKNIAILFVILFAMACKTDPVDLTIPLEGIDIAYTFPEESEPHEGTWLQWPHQYQYGLKFREDLDLTWVALVRELIDGENVHIIAYDNVEKARIIALLEKEKIDLTNVDFRVYETDDFWVRDNGPIYVRDSMQNLVIEDWGFNGWGQKADYEKCDKIPAKIGADQALKVVDLNDVVINEGGSVEMDGNGTLMACKSSILNRNRNPDMTTRQVENIFKHYLGVTNFVWLDGQAGLDITDSHIDGFARFGNSETIVTMNNADLLYYNVTQDDIDRLLQAKNKDGVAYKFIKLPLTKNDVKSGNGKNLGRASYCNYYIANTKVIVPVYGDANDNVALQLIQTLYPNRKVVGIDCRNVYEYGGMIHCITQQQPKP